MYFTIGYDNVDISMWLDDNIDVLLSAWVIAVCVIISSGWIVNIQYCRAIIWLVDNIEFSVLVRMFS